MTMKGHTESSIITVKLKYGGWEVELTCPEDKLQSKIRSVLSELPASVHPRPLNTLRETLSTLIDEGWFNSPRTASEAAKELMSRGYFYAYSTVPHALSDFASEGKLIRLGKAKEFAYRTMPT